MLERDNLMGRVVYLGSCFLRYQSILAGQIDAEQFTSWRPESIAVASYAPIRSTTDLLPERTFCSRLTDSVLYKVKYIV